MIILSPGQVHMWMTQPEAIQDTSLLARYSELLSSEEKEMRRRFHFEKDRKRYLCTRALVRSVLSEYAPVAPREWEFESNAFDKPEIRSTNRHIPPLRFNLTHSDKLIACAVTLKNNIGVDIENTVRSADFLKIADRHFSPREIFDLNSIPVHQRETKFFEYWTLKEAYIKACGKGLQIPLDVFTMDLTRQDKVSITFNGRQEDDPNRWQFQLFHLHEDHYLSLALETPLPLAPDSVHLFEGIPLSEFSSADCQLVRHS